MLVSLPWQLSGFNFELTGNIGSISGAMYCETHKIGGVYNNFDEFGK